MTTQPELVSCVMATMPNRRRFLCQALKYFVRQTLPRRELIVVDDPGESAFDLVRSIPNARYLQTGKRLSLGNKLNLGIEESHGDIIQKMDDDDYYHAHFLEATTSALRERNQVNSVAACDGYLVLIAATGQVKCRGQGVFAGGTLCFFRELWRKRPFRDIMVAEDRLFVKDNGAAWIAVVNPELYIYVRHDYGHLWNRFLEAKRYDDGWVTAGDHVTEYFERRPNYFKTLKDCVPEEDLRFYESLRRTRASEIGK